MAVPFIDLKRFEPGFLDAWNARVAQMSLNAQFIGGAVIEQLEQRLSVACEVSHAVTCANGTDAIQLALRALGVGRGDVVLVPDLTFWATFEAVVNVGADPVTVDCRRDDQSLSIDRVREALQTYQPKAVIVVHLYGWGSQNLQALRSLCREQGVALLEDAAQSWGVRLDGQSIMQGAHIATTSFYPAKVLGAAGDGGAVFCQDEALAASVRSLANHGRVAHYGHGVVGWNSRMDALQAAFVDLSLQHVQARVTARRASADRYRRELAALAPRLQVIAAPAGYEENGYCNVCLVDDAADKLALESALKAAGIGFGNIYPSPMSAQPGAQAYLKGKVGRADAAWLCSHVLNLPLFPYMRDDELGEVIALVRKTLS